MTDHPSVVGFFKALVTDQLISRAVEATVGAVVAGPLGAVLVPVVGKVIDYYGPSVANSAWRWLNGRPAEEACATLEAVANLDARTARSIIDTVVEETAPGAPPEAKSIARSYLASIPATLRQTLPRTPSGKSTCPAALLPRTEQDVFRLLPTFLPPYNAPCSLPGTPYQLHELLGTGGFGAVYKATVASEREGRALKFCLDPERTAVLKLEKDRLDRLVSDEGGRDWPENVVRLIGHNLEHETPFLVFEYVPDGDLGIHVRNVRVKSGRAMQPDEVFAVMRKLAFAVKHVHEKGLTHRDLKPSNILFAGQTVKLADFGMGAVVPRQHRAVSRQRSSAETTEEMRGGTWQYMSPEQKRNWKVTPHPTQDIYSLGVIWYQLLVDDFREEPGLSLDRRLTEQAVPAKHTELLKKCLDDRPGERPQNAGDLVDLIDRILRGADEEEARARLAVSRQKQAQEEATRREQEQADWTWARERGRGSIARYRTYLQKWPSGPHAPEARQEIERLEVEAEQQGRKFRLVAAHAGGGTAAGAVVLGGLGGLGGAIGWTTIVFPLLGLVLGAVVGALVGLMFSPFGGLYRQQYLGDCGHGERWAFGPVSEDVVKGFAVVGAVVGAIGGLVGVICCLNWIQIEYHVSRWEWTAGAGLLWGGLAGALIGLIAGLVFVFRKADTSDT
jgi:serine/threonine protein kinase